MGICATCLADNVDGTMQYLTELFLSGRPGSGLEQGRHRATLVDTGHWQSIKGAPQTKTIELTNVLLTFGGKFNPMPSHLSLSDGLENYFRPNLPWAADHFLERVSGLPINPGEQYKNWPWYSGNVPSHQTVDEREEPQFSHTYMERYWPRYANTEWEDQRPEGDSPVNGRVGIRYRYGDLNDVVDLLAREPYTRQAFLPVWFPEDTGAHHMERVPCTLGYHFMLRDDKLHIFYPIRSCDFVRYLRDDAYMAARLGLWIINAVACKTPGDIAHGIDESQWDMVSLGELNMFMPSLHIFEGDVPMLQRKGMPIMRGWEED